MRRTNNEELVFTKNTMLLHDAEQPLRYYSRPAGREQYSAPVMINRFAMNRSA